MQTLAIDPAVPFAMADGQLVIGLVGCGGTGSYIAQALARLVSHMRDSGKPAPALIFIDGDHVESKNVGRQLFSPPEVGLNKAQTLAARFSQALGLRISAIPEMATTALLQSLIPSNQGYNVVGILIGAVDGAMGRRMIHNTLVVPGPWRVWVDAGNHEYSGQVVVGTTTDAKALHGSFKLGGLCTALPTPSLVYPDLVKPEVTKPRADCAAAMEDNRQSLMVNQMMAAIVSEYVYKLVVHRQISTFQTVVDLGSLAMRSTTITAVNIAEATGVDVEMLRGTKSIKKARKQAQKQGAAA